MAGTRAASDRTIRVLVVDDSPLMRQLLASALGGQSDIVVVGTAADAAEAETQIKLLEPDVITLDVNLPVVSGLVLLEKIMVRWPIPVVMVSALTSEGAETSLTALELGAVDIIEKPRGLDAMKRFGGLLQEKVRNAAAARATRLGACRAIRELPERHASPAVTHFSAGRHPPAQAKPLGAFWQAQQQPAALLQPPPQSGAAAARVRRRSLIAIGASTGGVAALGRLLSELPDGLPPIVIVQHMPQGYPERFAARLRQQLGRDVAEAREGEGLARGMIRIAPAARHVALVRRNGRIETTLLDTAPVSGHRPSADVLFESTARSLGQLALGVVLTGMGRDGAAGLATMRRSGAMCLGQGPASSVVYGMARAAREIGGIDEEHELAQLPRRICQVLNG